MSRSTAVRSVDSILRDLALPARTFPASFTPNTEAHSHGLRFGQHQESELARLPDVTAIILNWSRLENVIRIVSLLCGPWLDDTIAEVFVWNNSPHQLSKETFAEAHCDTRKLRIENSSTNLYFYARFLACTKVSTPYCFIQDDDYIVLPEVVKTLRARIERSSRAIYLLPPHEHLSSRFRTTITPSGIHTGFAWLGHGTMIHRQQALHFVSLLHHDSPGMTEEQIKMADNYFSILSNDIPEIWFDQAVELEGGQPFTVGPEGDERNRKHIRDACRYLDEVLARHSHSPASDHISGQIASLAFVKLDSLHDDHRLGVNRTSALGTPYLLESNIRVLPDGIPLKSHAAIDLLWNEERCTQLMGDGAMSHYQKHPLSCAVDGIPGTAFRSPYHAARGDYILIDMLSIFEFHRNVVEVAFLLASDNEEIMRRSLFEYSLDGEHWTLSPHQPVSRSTMMVAESSSDQCDELIECSVRMAGDRARYFKATLSQDVPLSWVVHEVWVRSVLQS